MVFSSIEFLVFFAVVFAAYWRLPTWRVRKAWLLAASYVFYGWWDWRFLGLIFATTALDYTVALLIERSQNERRRRALITCSITANLGVLAFFKYFNFFLASAHAAAGWLGVGMATPALNILLPVGISFFTFQTMSYTIDVYRRQIPADRDFLNFALFIAFFPQLVAGPIVRAVDFLPQLATPKIFDRKAARRLLVLFLIGYLKKVCVADSIGAMIDPVFKAPTDYGRPDLWASAVAYSIQIYCDFSGYTDMAIGVAGLLGFHFERNFSFPYLSRNIQDFWRNWHISLSTWLRDYLYIPLGGNRSGRRKAYRNLMITMLLGGLWHGANWTFVLWGALHGAALALHRFLTAARPSRFRMPPLAGMALTYLFVVLCWVPFRAQSFAAGRQYLLDLVLRHHAHRAPVWGVGGLAALGLLAALHALFKAHEAAIFRQAETAAPPAYAMAFGACAAAALLMTRIVAPPFIYFQF